MHRVVVCPRMINSSLVANTRLAVVGIYAWWQLHSESDQFFVFGSWNMIHSAMRFGQVGTTSDKLRS